jgi:hypothetical protein
MSRFLIPILYASVLASSPHIGGPADDPALGVWRLDAAKCRFSAPLPSVSVFRSYQAADGGLTRIQETRQATDGQQVIVEYAAVLDGREYPIQITSPVTGELMQSEDTVALRRIDVRTVAGVFRSRGKQTSEFTRTLSEDGQALSVRVVGFDASGKPTVTLLVYDRMLT